jgi:hypothetical protein
MSISSKEELQAYCLRSLGAPLVEIDVTPDSLDDAIEESLEFFQEYYFDGSDRFFYKHLVTQNDLDTGSILLPDHIWGVNALFQMTNTSSSQANIFDFEYQFRASDMMRNLQSSDLIYYTQMMQHLSLAQNLLSIQHSYRFNRNSGRLFIDMNWAQRVSIGNYLMIDCYSILDPETNTKFYNNREFKDYCVARIKMKWAMAYKKYSNISLPGGVTIDGSELYNEAKQELADIEENMINNQSPLGFFVG